MSEETNYVTEEVFYAEIDRAMKNVREDMKVRTVLMRLENGIDVALPIISVYKGEIIVGPACSLKYDMDTGRMVELTGVGV